MSDNNVTKWEKLIAIGTVAQAAVVIFSLIFIQRQLSLQTDQLKLQTNEARRQTRLASAANFQALASLAIPLNLEEAKNPETERLWLAGSAGFKKDLKITDEEIKKEQYRALLSTWMIFYENMFYQHTHRLLADDVYGPWDKDLKDFVEDYLVGDSWPRMRDSYHKQFRNHVDKILKEKPTPTPTPEPGIKND